MGMSPLPSRREGGWVEFAAATRVGERPALEERLGGDLPEAEGLRLMLAGAVGLPRAPTSDALVKQLRAATCSAQLVLRLRQQPASQAP